MRFAIIFVLCLLIVFGLFGMGLVSGLGLAYSECLQQGYFEYGNQVMFCGKDK